MVISLRELGPRSCAVIHAIHVSHQSVLSIDSTIVIVRHTATLFPDMRAGLARKPEVLYPSHARLARHLVPCEQSADDSHSQHASQPQCGEGWRLPLTNELFPYHPNTANPCGLLMLDARGDMHTALLPGNLEQGIVKVVWS
jgi:hypothetical protein